MRRCPLCLGKKHYRKPFTDVFIDCDWCIKSNAQNHIEEKRQAIDDEIDQQIDRLQAIIEHFGETKEDYKNVMNAIFLERIEYQPMILIDIAHYKNVRWECYHSAMSWLIDETQITNNGETQ